MIALEQAAVRGAGAPGALARAGTPPATPDASQAGEAAQRELAKPAYAERADPLTAAWHWIQHHIDLGSVIPGIPPWASATILVLALTALIVVIGAMARRVTIARLGGEVRGSLFEDDRDAAALTSAADLAADRGDFATAVVDRFRAIIRSLDERSILEDYPGLTAHEAAGLAADALPGLSADLHSGARLFDAVRYGDVMASPEEDAWMRALAADVEAQAGRARRDAGRPADAATASGARR
ncbi:hypothetical protein CHIBA101_1930 [Actinomyces sp. Chiba101]|uniref:Protein-glutamine gamma-glutamyltransferase-like C-terminal domain-containing protein n=1 Tax=Actinomyces denticolens TaxID=52767 RepID=A0ABY1HY41_9ACTO|nr:MULTISPECIES: DUF4129 domain-containing protein [Actinomyces]BAW93762.1 hypothetical protein CHIBA101_1930 [Actinomyces sp. Chiba101]GAV93991.1 hypothetical protein ADENT20671_0756 [Actinomyces denticolens]SHI29664.1 protein of unknown function [Actinomyces denticolens]SUU74272.1 Uncharacterised protein [Actinomyces denticolens]